MHPPSALLAFLAATASVNPALATRADDEAAVRKVFDAFRDDWNGPGFPNLETLLKPNADFVVVTGKWLKGRESIVAYHRRLLQTFYAGTMRDKPSDGPPSPR